MRKKHHRVMIIIKKQDQVPSRNKRRSQITGKGFITKIIIKKKRRSTICETSSFFNQK